jgi:SAM-dependent methyltransferase
MAEPPQTYDPHRFRTTVPYYSRYRLGDLPAAIDRVSQIVGLQPGDSVMDLGCGPGLLAIVFARAGRKVTAIDAEPAMLEAARKAAREGGVSLDLRIAGSFDWPAGIGPFRLVTMGRSFGTGPISASTSVSLRYSGVWRTEGAVWLRKQIRSMARRRPVAALIRLL